MECADGSSPSQVRPYAPPGLMHKNLASTSASRSDLHNVRSTPQSRCACSSVSRRPGISRYSARRRPSSELFAISTSQTRFTRTADLRATCGRVRVSQPAHARVLETSRLMQSHRACWKDASCAQKRVRLPRRRPVSCWCAFPNFSAVDRRVSSQIFADPRCSEEEAKLRVRWTTARRAGRACAPAWIKLLRMPNNRIEAWAGYGASPSGYCATAGAAWIEAHTSPSASHRMTSCLLRGTPDGAMT